MKKAVRSALVLGVVAIALVLAACGGGKPEVEVTTNAQGFKQVEAIDMVLQWKISGSTIEIIVTAPGDGWVGVGFDPEEFMKGANFILGYVADGTTTIQDHYGNQLINHAHDSDLGGTDDVTVLGGSEDANGTMLHFSIPLDSGDQYDKPLSAGTKHKVLLAYGTTDDYGTQHAQTHRTSLELTL